MMSAELLGFESIMLDSIELLADSGRVSLPRISYTLEVSAMN